MRDQAASLRELKANYERMVSKPKAETSYDFLSKIKRNTPLFAYILIYPDSLNAKFPEIDNWLSKLTNAQHTYLWDQANLINNKVLTSKSKDLLSFPVLPKQMAMLDIISKTDSERIDFLKNLSNNLDKQSEVWITIKASEISYYTYLFNASNRLYIMLPDYEDTVLKGYEIVKTLYGLKIPTPINLLEFSSNSFFEEAFTSNRIKNVAKKFLGIDLYYAGVVLSNGRYIPPINEENQKSIKNQTGASCSDFMYSFSENIVNLTLGTN